MSNFEVEAASRALSAYGEMSRDYLAAVSDQPVGEAALDDIRQRTAHAMAGLNLVHGLLDVLPMASASSNERVSVQRASDIPRILGTMVWGFGIENKEYKGYGNAPYYIIGHRAVGTGQPQTAELLLAPAVPKSERPDKLLVAQTWEVEVGAADAMLETLLNQQVTPDQVSRFYNPKTNTLEIPGANEFLWNGPPQTLWTDGYKYRQKDANTAMSRKYAGLRANDRWDLAIRTSDTSDFKDSLTFNDRIEFSVIPRLIRLATIHGRTEELSQLLETLPDATDPMPLTVFVEKQ